MSMTALDVATTEALSRMSQRSRGMRPPTTACDLKSSLRHHLERRVRLPTLACRLTHRMRFRELLGVTNQTISSQASPQFPACVAGAIVPPRAALVPLENCFHCCGNSESAHRGTRHKIKEADIRDGVRSSCRTGSPGRPGTGCTHGTGSPLGENASKTWPADRATECPSGAAAGREHTRGGWVNGPKIRSSHLPPKWTGFGPLSVAGEHQNERKIL
jgi:hypothetical protein